MSRIFSFFPAIKTAEGKYNCLLWQKNKNGEFKPADVYWASSSFIDGEWFLENGRKLKAKEVHEDIASEFLWSFNDKTPIEEKECYLYELTLDTIASALPTRGLIEGYVPVDEAKAFGMCEDIYEQQEYVAWHMSIPISASVFAELPTKEKEKYCKISFVDTYSAGYICQMLNETLKTVSDNIDNDNETPCILMHYSF